MKKHLLLSLLVICSFAARAQTLLNESFDGTTFPPTGWTSAGSGTNTYNSIVNWIRVTSGGGYYPAPSTYLGNGMANYNSYWINSGSAELRSPSLNFTATGSKILSFWVYQVTGYTSDSLAVYVNTTASAGGTQLLSLAPDGYNTSSGWTHYTFTIPASYNTATNYIIFKGISAYGDDIFLDEVSVINQVPCSGTPSGGVAYSIPSSSVCSGVPFTLYDSAYTVASGITFQWQSSPAGANTFTNIAGATSPTYTAAAGISSATDYRFKVTCSNSSVISYSNTVSLSLNAPANCYCTPVYTVSCSSQDDINTITLTGANSTSINQLNT